MKLDGSDAAHRAKQMFTTAKPPKRSVATVVLNVILTASALVVGPLAGFIIAAILANDLFRAEALNSNPTFIAMYLVGLLTMTLLCAIGLAVYTIVIEVAKDILALRSD